MWRLCSSVKSEHRRQAADPEPQHVRQEVPEEDLVVTNLPVALPKALDVAVEAVPFEALPTLGGAFPKHLAGSYRGGRRSQSIRKSSIAFWG